MYQIFNIARATFSTSSVDTMITNLVDSVGDVLTLGLATVLALVAVLIGLFFVLRLVRKYIGTGR